MELPRPIADRFVARAPIGAGGLCTVWEAEDLRTGQLVALKLAHQGRKLSDGARARFEREARMLAELAHPNVVSIVDYGVDPEQGAFLAMERLRGPSLWDATNEEPLPLRAVIAWLAPIAAALERSHAFHSARKLVASRDRPRRLVHVGLELLGERALLRVVDFERCAAFREARDERLRAALDRALGVERPLGLEFAARAEDHTAAREIFGELGRPR